MIFNLAQKYGSVLSTFLNTILIVKFLDLEHLGLYAFLAASGNIFTVFVSSGLRSMYLREIVKHRDNLENQRIFTATAEILPKIAAIVIAGIFLAVAWLASFSIEDAATIALIGTMLASSQMTSQKLRSHGLNTLSQMVLNVRPVVLTLLLLFIGLTDVETLKTFFRGSIIASFAIPAILAYTFWIVKFRSLVFSRVRFSAIIHGAWKISKELPGLFMLAMGQKVTTRSDVILLTVLLGLEAAGTYRIATQIVTVANSSQFPIQSKFLKKYARLLYKEKLRAAEIIAQRVARISVALYLSFFFAAVVVIYHSPYLEEIKYRPDFIWSLGFLALTGLVQAGFPMVESYVVYRNNTNKGGLIQLGVVIGNILLHLMLIPLLGLPGACLTALISVLFWRFAVKKFL